MDKCFYCGSANLVKDVQIKGQRPVGISYFLDQQGPFGARLATAEPLFAELCRDCGSVRAYVKDRYRDWER